MSILGDVSFLSRNCSFAEALKTRKDSVINQLLSKNPDLGKNLYSSLQVLIKEKRRCPIEEREPLEHYAAEQLVKTSTEICYGIEKHTLDIRDIKDMTENLVRMLERILKLAPAVGAPFAVDIRKFIFCVQDIADALQKELKDRICPIDWASMAHVLMKRVQTVEVKPRNIFNYIPKIGQIEVIRLIGAGGFGSVFKATYLPSATMICIKLVPENKLPAIDLAAADKLVASIINSPFLINYLCVFQAQGAYVTMMEYMPAVDLNRILQRSRVLPIDVLRYTVLQTFLGIEHLHLKGFVHRDIKIQNVLIKDTGHVKVIDFDTNKLCLSHFVKDRTLTAFFKRTSKEFHDSEMAGTLTYMAPELFKGYPYGRALDWWALGVMVYRLLIGHLPFRGTKEDQLREKVLRQKPDWTPTVHECNEASDLGMRLMRKSPVQRLGSGSSYREIRVHSFFEGIDLENFYKQPNLCEVPHIREAMNPDDPAKGADSPLASRGSRNRVTLELRNVKDARAASMKPILTFASPGFIRLLDHLRSSKDRTDPDPSFCDERKLYGLGTLSSELNYEWDAVEPGNYCRLEAIESILGIKRFTKILLRADQKLIFGGFSYKVDLKEVNSVHGICGFVWSIKGKVTRNSGLVAGDIIYEVDDVKFGEGLRRIRQHMKAHRQVEVSVFSINAFRLTKQGIDVPVVFGRLGHTDLLVTREIKRILDVVQAFEVFTMEATRPNSRPSQIHMIAGIHENLVVSQPTGGKLYVGDVLLAINGISASTFKRPDDLIAGMRKVRGEDVMITVLPISPLRYPD